MNQPKHTPGPWAFEKNGELDAVYSSKGDRICEVIGSIDKPGIDGANARLMAAAPEVIRDLEEAGKLLLFLSGHLAGRMGEEALSDIEKRARSYLALVAKATGRA